MWQVRIVPFRTLSQTNRARIIRAMTNPRAEYADARTHTFTGTVDATAGTISSLFSRESAARACAFDIETRIGGCRAEVSRFLP